MKRLRYLYHRKKLTKHYFLHRAHQLRLSAKMRMMEDFIEHNEFDREPKKHFLRYITNAELYRFFYPQDEVEIVSGRYKGFRTFISSVEIAQGGGVSLALDGFMMTERDTANKNTPLRARYMTFHPSAVKLIDPVLNYPTRFYIARLPRPPYELVRVSQLSATILPRPVRYDTSSKLVSDLLNSASESNSLVTTPEDVLQSTDSLGSLNPLFVQEQILFEHSHLDETNYNLRDKEARIKRFEKRELTEAEKRMYGLAVPDYNP